MLLSGLVADDKGCQPGEYEDKDDDTQVSSFIKCSLYIHFVYLLCVTHHRHHFSHTPLGVRSTKHRHQSPEWMILSHVIC